MAAIFFLLFCLPFLYGCGWAAMFVRVRDKCTFHYDNDNNNTSTEERKKGERKKKKKKNFFLAQWSLRRMRRNGLGNSRGPLLMDMYTQTPMHFSRFFFRYIYISILAHTNMLMDPAQHPQIFVAPFIRRCACQRASEWISFVVLFHMKHMPGYRDR